MNVPKVFQNVVTLVAKSLKRHGVASVGEAATNQVDHFAGSPRSLRHLRVRQLLLPTFAIVASLVSASCKNKQEQRQVNLPELPSSLCTVTTNMVPGQQYPIKLYIVKMAHGGETLISVSPKMQQLIINNQDDIETIVRDLKGHTNKVYWDGLTAEEAESIQKDPNNQEAKDMVNKLNRRMDALKRQLEVLDRKAKGANASPEDKTRQASVRADYEESFTLANKISNQINFWNSLAPTHRYISMAQRGVIQLRGGESPDLLKQEDEFARKRQMGQFKALFEPRENYLLSVIGGKDPATDGEAIVCEGDGHEWRGIDEYNEKHPGRKIGAYFITPRSIEPILQELNKK